MRSRLEGQIVLRQTGELINESFSAINVALNEVTIGRGPYNNHAHLELYINEKLVTQVDGDGLIVSTPTGSTAYALSAGGGLVHPSVPAILISPMCHHSLSFRSFVVPSDSRLKIRILPETKHAAYISFDGRQYIQLDQTRDFVITTSSYFVPTLVEKDNTWFSDLQEVMQWNKQSKYTSLVSITDNM